MRTANELLLEAIEHYEEEREVTHTSNAVDGVVTDRDAIDTIAKYDAWLRDARAAVAPEVQFRCGTCEKPIKSGCYCSKKCADADE